MWSQRIDITEFYSKISRIRYLCWNCSSYFTVNFGKIYQIFLISSVFELFSNCSRIHFFRVVSLVALRINRSRVFGRTAGGVRSVFAFGGRQMFAMFLWRVVRWCTFITIALEIFGTTAAHSDVSSRRERTCIARKVDSAVERLATC